MHSFSSLRPAFLLFEEPPNFAGIPQGAKEYSGERLDRRHWKAVEFAERYDLKLVGANYFLCRGLPPDTAE
jgi:phosphatidylethanolamine-binding protein